MKETAQKTEETTSDAGAAATTAAAAAEQKTAGDTITTTRAIETATSQSRAAALPEMLTLEASYGNISFPHAVHAASFACSSCHGEATPAAFGLTKETAHPLCKGCHQEQGTGPTTCTGCHKK